MKNKTIIKMTMVIWVVTACIVIAGAVILAGTSGFGGFRTFNFGNFSYTSYQSAEVIREMTVQEAVENIKIDWLSGKVNIIKNTTNEFRVVQKGPKDLEQKYLMQTYVENGTLYVSEREKEFFGYIGVQPTTFLDIYVPETEYNLIEVDSASASVEMEQFTANQLQISTASGSIKTSGTFERVDVNTMSGSIRSDSLVAKVLSANTASGSVRVEGSVEDASMNTMSGSVRLTTNVMPKRLNCDTASGSVEINIPENDGFTAHVSQMSGSFKSSFPMTTQGQTRIYKNGQSEINVSTMSGSCRIEKI